MAKKMKPGDPIFDMAMPYARDALLEFRPCMLCEDETNRTMYDILNSYFTPGFGKDYGHNDEHTNDLLNPTPADTLERAVSGIISFHYSPSEPFMGLKKRDYVEMEDTEATENAEDAKALNARTHSIRSIIQSPENFSVMTQAARETLKVGVCGKTVDPDPVNMASMQYYPFDQIGVATSNGKILDIYMVCEELTRFQARMRFPSIASDPSYWTERKVDGVFDGEKKKYYRLNLPLPVIRQHMMDRLRSVADDENSRKKFVDSLFPEKDNNTGIPGNVTWADIWFCDEMICSIDLLDYHPIMINCAAPPYNVRSFARGQGEKSLSLLMAITHAFEKTITAFDRTYDPSWSVVDENQRLGLDLSSGSVSFKEAGTDDPTPLSLNAEIRGAVEWGQYLQMLYDRIFYLDVFELLNKSRMTKAEVQVRDTDDFRKMTMFLVEDQKTNLNPMALSINHIIHKHLVDNNKEDRLADMKLQAVYTSDVAYASKNSVFTKVRQNAQMVLEVGTAMAEDNPMNDVVDLPNYFAGNMMKAGEPEILRDEDDRVRKETIRTSREKIADQGAALQAIGGGQGPSPQTAAPTQNTGQGNPQGEIL